MNATAEYESLVRKYILYLTAIGQIDFRYKLAQLSLGFKAFVVCLRFDWFSFSSRVLKTPKKERRRKNFVLCDVCSLDLLTFQESANNNMLFLADDHTFKSMPSAKCSSHCQPLYTVHCKHRFKTLGYEADCDSDGEDRPTEWF